MPPPHTSVRPPPCTCGRTHTPLAATRAHPHACDHRHEACSRVCRFAFKEKGRLEPRQPSLRDFRGASVPLTRRMGVDHGLRLPGLMGGEGRGWPRSAAGKAAGGHLHGVCEGKGLPLTRPLPVRYPQPHSGCSRHGPSPSLPLPPEPLPICAACCHLPPALPPFRAQAFHRSTSAREYRGGVHVCSPTSWGNDGRIGFCTWQKREVAESSCKQLTWEARIVVVLSVLQQGKHNSIFCRDGNQGQR